MTNVNDSLSLPVLLTIIQCNPDLSGAREAFLVTARRVAAQPIIRRPYRYADVGTHRSWLDGRAKVLEPEIQETFALAMADYGADFALAEELPLLAAAYRLSGDEQWKVRVSAQIEEMAGWSPLQRPGWTCFERGSRLPADGKDGAWLATGFGVRALADTLEILPAKSLPAALRARLASLLEAEIAQVVDDWRSRRPWFVQANNPITNQWVLPTEGLIRACLTLGVERHRAAYELGVANMLAALNAHGADGEFEEGYGYAAATAGAFLAAARAMGVAGDRRLLDHPYLQRFPLWLAHHLQPARLLINAFDCFTATVPRYNPQFAGLLAQLAVCTGNPTARWMLTRQFDRQTDTLWGLLAQALPDVGEGAAPPPFAAYSRATRVNWRDRWDDAASGVWVRGGHATDQHDHQDRGHVSFISRGRPILIEAGTPAYHHPQLGSYFASCVGHNVLQVGETLPEKAPAPITVHRLDEAGGDITVDGTACYHGLARWQRRVTWTAPGMTIADTVELAAGQRDIVCFRWHLGAGAAVAISGAACRFTAAWADATLAIEGSVPLVVTQQAMPDNSLIPRTWDDPTPDHLHTCLEVHTAQPVRELTIIVRILPT